LHTHTNKSDGENLPEKVLNIYEKMGYTFLAITDHGIISDPDEYNTKLILFSGIEADCKGARHACIINMSKNNIIYSPEHSHQKLIDENINKGSIVVLNHPDWELKEHYPIDELYNLHNYPGIEIYNSVIERLLGTPLSSAKWDKLLSEGKKILGFANQDSHKQGDYLDCCNVVRIKNVTKKDIFESLITGNFYCYYGVEIIDVGRNGNEIFIKTKNAKLIRFIGFGGIVLKKIKSNEARIKFADDTVYRYIRIECLGVGEKISWTQPFFRE